MLKQTQINIADTNLALFGSPIEKEIKQWAAHTEEMWKGVGRVDGLEIWRIEKFKLAVWPKAQYGKFHEGDSYIVLKTQKIEEAFKWDVHFWLGKFTSQDEAGTAAYKTVELDDFLGGTPVQHREVDGHESDLFLSYFPKLVILPGGVESGFHHVEAAQHRTRLLHLKGLRKNIVAREAPLEASSLNSGDAFILDDGKEIWVFIGKSAGIGEKTKATQLARAIDDERGSTVQIHVLAEHEMNGTDDSTNKFWEHLGGRASSIAAASADDKPHRAPSLHKISDASGALTIEQVTFSRANLHSSDAFIVDVGNEIFVWIGNSASPAEKKYAMQHGQTYLKTHDLPPYLPVTRVLEGAENEILLSHFAK